MNLALDTNAYTAFCKGDAILKEIIEGAGTITFPLPVLAELRSGFACGNRQSKNERNLELFLNAPRVIIRSPNEATTFLYAQLFRQLKEAGNKIPTNDLWIATLALQYDAILATYDHHFKHIVQLPTLPG